MKPGNTIKRTDLMGSTVERTIRSEGEATMYYDQLKDGFEFEVLIDGEWKPVPRPVTIHRAPPESCPSCEA